MYMKAFSEKMFNMSITITQFERQPYLPEANMLSNSSLACETIPNKSLILMLSMPIINKSHLFPIDNTFLSSKITTITH